LATRRGTRDFEDAEIMLIEQSSEYRDIETLEMSYCEVLLYKSVY